MVHHSRVATVSSCFLLQSWRKILTSLCVKNFSTSEVTGVKSNMHWGSNTAELSPKYPIWVTTLERRKKRKTGFSRWWTWKKFSPVPGNNVDEMDTASLDSGLWLSSKPTICLEDLEETENKTPSKVVLVVSFLALTHSDLSEPWINKC